MAQLLAMPLDRFAHAGQSLEVRVRRLDRPLWFAPDETAAGFLSGRACPGERRGPETDHEEHGATPHQA